MRNDVSESALSDRSESSPSDLNRPRRTWSFDGRKYLTTLAIVALCTLLSWLSHAAKLTDANIVMIFLAGVALVAARFGHGPAVAAAILSVALFDFFFVQPTFAFAPTDAEYFITLAVMLGIGLLISELTARLQSQLQAARQQEYRTAQLHEMTMQLNERPGLENLVSSAGRILSGIFASDVVIYLRGLAESLNPRFGSDSPLAREVNHEQLANWVLTNNQSAGQGTVKFPRTSVLYIPMIGAERTIGILAVRPSDPQTILDADQRHMLATCANLIALSIERDQSRDEAQVAQVQVRAEQLRNSLLSAVSHDLRTPLAMIAVTASSLLDDDGAGIAASHRENLQIVVDETDRLARQVDNLLEMARLNSGTLVVNRDWHVLEELVGVALARMRRDLAGRELIVKIPDDFPMLYVADDLIEQVLVNLLENAARYTPTGSRIEIVASRCGDTAQIIVADNGSGLPAGCQQKIFDKFFRAATVVADGQRGIGLGLAICKSIVELHGGTIAAANRPAGGAEFAISLPSPSHSPTMATDEAIAANT